MYNDTECNGGGAGEFSACVVLIVMLFSSSLEMVHKTELDPQEVIEMTIKTTTRSDETILFIHPQKAIALEKKLHSE
jgi:hypothetical protein